VNGEKKVKYQELVHLKIYVKNVLIMEEIVLRHIMIDQKLNEYVLDYRIMQVNVSVVEEEVETLLMIDLIVYILGVERNEYVIQLELINHDELL